MLWVILSRIGFRLSHWPPLASSMQVPHKVLGEVTNNQTLQVACRITSPVPIVYSILNACTGSMEAALRAGMSVANTPINPIRRATPASVHGSSADTPKS